MHTPFAPRINANPTETGMHGWLEALSRLGLGLDAGLMNMSLEVAGATTRSGDENAPLPSPESTPYTRPGSH